MDLKNTVLQYFIHDLHRINSIIKPHFKTIKRRFSDINKLNYFQ